MAASKFGKIPPCCTVKRGYITLRDHENVVMYPNLNQPALIDDRDARLKIAITAGLPLDFRIQVRRLRVRRRSLK